MIRGRWHLGIVLALATSAAMGQTTRPAAVPKDVPDAWLAQLAMRRLAEATRTGRYAALREELRQAVLARLTVGGTANLEPLNDVAYVINACEQLAPTESMPEGRPYAQWLIANRQVSRLLFRTMVADRPRADGLKGMYELYRGEPKLAAEFPNLAVAFATATPQPWTRQQVDCVDAVGAFRWYIRECRGSRYDLKKMPYELSRFLACTRLSVAERRWAVQTYAKENNPDRIYNALDYDWDHVRKGVPKKIAALPFTLQNLRKVGGVCLERSYFASEVFRAMGTPAVMVTGSGQRGEHAWLAVLQKTPGGRSVKWDMNTGRYSDDKYYVGEVFDPVRGRDMTDCDLSISLAALLLPLHQREHAASALQLAQWVEEARDAWAGAGGEAAAATGIERLRRLAGEYNLLLAAKPASRPAEGVRLTAPPVNVATLTAGRGLDEHVVEELVTQALNNNMVHNPAWDFVIAMGQKGRLRVERVGRFVDVLLKKTAGEYPDYGCSRALKLIGTFPSGEQRANLYDRAGQVFAHRPDLSGQILIAAGRGWQELGKEKAAMSSFDKAVQITRKNAATVLMEAMKAMEDVYRKNNQLDAAIALYYRYYQQSPHMDMNSLWRTASERYRLGSRLIELLQETGKEAAAKKIAGELDPQAKKDKPKK